LRFGEGAASAQTEDKEERFHDSILVFSTGAFSALGF
jgi:hypothetical protein